MLTKVNMPEQDKETQQEVSVAHLIPLEELQGIKDERLCAKLSNRLLERLVVESYEGETLKVVFDESLQTIAEEQRAKRQQAFDEQVVKNNSDQVTLQVPDPSVLGIERAQLLDCDKASTTTLIGQRTFKVTCYFLNFLRSFNRVSDAIFEWQVIYVEAYLSTLDTNLVIVLTERDLRQMVSLLKETTQN